MIKLFGSLITGHKRVNLQYLFPNATSLLGIKMVSDLKPHEVIHSCAELTFGTTQPVWAKPAGNSWYSALRVAWLIIKRHLSISRSAYRCSYALAS